MIRRNAFGVVDEASIQINVDPTSGAGFSAPIGTLAYYIVGSAAYLKTGSGNTNWTQVPLGASAAGPTGPTGPSGGVGPTGPTGVVGPTGPSSFDAGSIVTVSGSAVADMTISGLTGDTDGGYEFEGYILTTASSPLFTLQLNGSNQGHSVPIYTLWNGATATVSSAGPSALLEVGSNEQGAVSHVTFRGRIGSKQGLIQAFNCESLSARTDYAVSFGTNSRGQFIMGSQVTQVSIHANNGASIDVGSYLRVRKLGFAE